MIITGFARNGDMPQFLWLRIPIRRLNSACDFSQPYALFVSQILDYTACEIAQDACFSASLAAGDADGSCPEATIGHMGEAETWGGPRGCHVQEGANWQFNENGDEGSAQGHTQPWAVKYFVQRPVSISTVTVRVENEQGIV